MAEPTLTVVNPRDARGHVTIVFRPFTRAEADAFLMSWSRVEQPDGSAYAYAPDVATAKLIAAGPAMAEALLTMLWSAENPGDPQTTARMRGEARAALRRAGKLPLVVETIDADEFEAHAKATRRKGRA